MATGREVAILGVGMHPWGIFPEKNLQDLLVDAATKAFKDAGITWPQIQFAAGGVSPLGGMLGLVPCSTLADALGNTGIPTINTYNNCATGTTAFKVAYDAVKHGECDIALAIAADKTPGGFYPTMGVKDKNNTDYIRFEMVGLANPGYWALECTRRMKEYGTTEEQLAKVKVQCSNHGQHNPLARYRKAYTLEEVLNSPMVSYPLRLLEICATSDGAAAVVLCSMDVARKHTQNPVTVAAASAGTTLYGDTTMRPFDIGVPSKGDAPKVSESAQAIKFAYEQSGLGPEDLDLVELPDNSSWHWLTYTESVGLCKEGEAEQLLDSGATAIGGRIPVCPGGGSSSFGEAIPAQQFVGVCEIVWQLREEAGARQVEGARVGLAQTYGGQGNSGTIILKM